MSATLPNRTIVAFACRIAAVTLVAVPIAACQSDSLVTGSVPVAAADRHPIRVATEAVALDLPADGAMSEAERSAVYDFVMAYRQEGQGALEVLAPSGALNEIESQFVVGEVRKLAHAGGLPPTALSFSTYRSKSPSPPVTLRYERHAASAMCGQWPTNLDPNWRNEPYENFGCATQRNLAAMVEDPRDLYGPRPMTARDSQRRDVIFDNYRRGRETGARTGTDDAGTASRIGN